MLSGHAKEWEKNKFVWLRKFLRIDMDMSLIQGTISGLKTASDIAKSFLELNSMADVQGKVIQLQSAILSAQSDALSAKADQATMADEINALKTEISRVVAWDVEKHRYKLVEPWPGSLTYALRESMSNAEPPHYICTSCFEIGRKSILNPNKDKNGLSVCTQYYCPVCKSHVSTDGRGVGSAVYAQD